MTFQASYARSVQTDIVDQLNRSSELYANERVWVDGQ